jgi:raffinose/stachyose/melibiose transport system permease protein
MHLKKKKRAPTKESVQFFLLAAPVLILFAIFVVWPFLGGIFYSLTKWDGIAPTFQFVGLDNFRTLFQDFYVTRPMIQTFIYSFLITIFQNVLSLIMALALNQKLRTKGLLRTLWFIPVVIAPLIVGYIWSFLFTNPIAQLGKALGIEDMANNLLGSRHTALYSGVFVSMWRNAGYTMVIYIAAFQNIPQEIYEAVHVDGARGWRRFWNVTFPLIAPAFTINMVLTMERGFKEFDMMFTLTNGGPENSSELISLTIYRETFEHFRAGYGSAMGVVLFVIIAVLSLVELYFLRRKEEDIVY